MLVTRVMAVIVMLVMMNDDRMFDDYPSATMTAMMMNMNGSPDLHF